MKRRRPSSTSPTQVIDDRLARAEALIGEADALLAQGDTARAYVCSLNASDLLASLGDLMYESHAVENRAVWYRAAEKSDAEVEATVKRLAAIERQRCVYRDLVQQPDHRDDRHRADPPPNTRAHGDYRRAGGLYPHRPRFRAGDPRHRVRRSLIGTTGQSDALIAESEKRDWRCIDRNGVDNFPNEYGSFVFLNPYNREMPDLILEIYREMLENYDLDGLHLDYIRFSEPQRDETKADFGYRRGHHCRLSGAVRHRRRPPHARKRKRNVAELVQVPRGDHRIPL